jgi:hypothetical protein
MNFELRSETIAKQIRNPKHEIRNKQHSSKSQTEKAKNSESIQLRLEHCVLNFFRASDLVFRIAHQTFAALRAFDVAQRNTLRRTLARHEGSQPWMKKEWFNTIKTPDASKATPTGALSLRPQGIFFSIAISAPRASIQPTLPMPTANIKSIKAQQQPTQKTP